MNGSEHTGWLESRTGLVTALQRFLREPIPASIGWRNTLGSVAGALLLLQGVTGFLLALYYVPHPEAAFESLEYVKSSITAGGLVRALHYWGASFIVVCLFLHLMRVVLSGAYRRPREATWLVGLALLGLTLGLAFTGQLLPWSQAGYWAANVGVEIASSAPVAGTLIRRLLLGGGELGALTLSRFYALHVILLPFLLGGGVALHLYLLRRQGPAPGPRDAAREPGRFHPDQTVRDMIAIAAVSLLLGAVAFGFGGPAESPIDPSDTSYVPRPEWYFLAHYELLSVTPGRFKIVTTFLLPTAIALLLAGLPWLDRTREGEPGGRRWVTRGATAFALGIMALTGYGILNGGKAGDQVASAANEAYDPILAGRALFERLNCQTCHRIGGVGMRVGPDLSGVGHRIQELYLREWLLDPQRFRPDTQMPPANVTRAELNELTAYLMSLSADPGD